MTTKTTGKHPPLRGHGAAWFVYNALGVLALPLITLYLLWRAVVRSKSLSGVSQRLGDLSEQLAAISGCPDPVIWVHAVSAGEVAAVAPVVQEIRLAEPMARIVLSTITDTGREMVNTHGIDPDAGRDRTVAEPHGRRRPPRHPDRRGQWSNLGSIIPAGAAGQADIQMGALERHPRLRPVAD
jgi:hypothetical protein